MSQNLKSSENNEVIKNLFKLTSEWEKKNTMEGIGTISAQIEADYQKRVDEITRQRALTDDEYYYSAGYQSPQTLRKIELENENQQLAFKEAELWRRTQYETNTHYDIAQDRIKADFKQLQAKINSENQRFAYQIKNEWEQLQVKAQDEANILQFKEEQEWKRMTYKTESEKQQLREKFENENLQLQYKTENENKRFICQMAQEWKEVQLRVESEKQQLQAKIESEFQLEEARGRNAVLTEETRGEYGLMLEETRGQNALALAKREHKNKLKEMTAEVFNRMSVVGFESSVMAVHKIIDEDNKRRASLLEWMAKRGELRNKVQEMAVAFILKHKSSEVEHRQEMEKMKLANKLKKSEMKLASKLGTSKKQQEEQDELDNILKGWMGQI